MFSNLQYLIILVLSVAAFVGAAWALIQGLRFPDSAYVSAGKLNKLKWGLILGAALTISFLGLPWPFGFGNGIMGFGVVLSVAAVIIFFVDVLPRLREQHRPSPGRAQDSRGGW